MAVNLHTLSTGALMYFLGQYPLNRIGRLCATHPNINRVCQDPQWRVTYLQIRGQEEVQRVLDNWLDDLAFDTVVNWLPAAVQAGVYDVTHTFTFFDELTRQKLYVTPLTAATFHGHVPLIRLLLAYGSDPYTYFNWGLVRASARGELDIVRLLMEHGADPTLNGYESIRVAQRENQQAVLDYYRQHGYEL